MKSHDSKIYKVFHVFKKIFVDILFPQSALAKEALATTPEQILSFQSHEIIFNNIHVLFPYHHKIIRELIWQLKYHHSEKSSELFAIALGDTLLEEISDLMRRGRTPIITTIPASAERMKKIGYSQTDLLLEKLAHHLPSEIIDSKILIRNKIAERQSKLKRHERLTNLKNVFAVANGKNIAGKTIYIIDDVVTTGATLSEVKKVLKKARAKEAYLIALAH